MSADTIRLLFTLLMLSPVFVSQELVRLQDGTVAEARVQMSGRQARLTTVFGEREVARQDILARGPVEEVRSLYLEQASMLPEGFLAGQVALARWALECGLLSGARAQLEAIFNRDIDQPEARTLAGRLAREWRVDASEGGERGRDHALLAAILFERLAPRSALDAVIALEKAAHLPAEVQRRWALQGLTDQAPWVRWLSARLLADHRDRSERIKPLFQRALLDPALAVRREAVRSLRVTGDPVFARLFARNLWHDQAVVRVHAGEALGELNMPEGVEPLVEALTDSWRPARNHLTSTTQVAYVKDFDVEVAQGAVIADPIVDVVQDGVVHDVAVVGITVERATYAASLVRLTGVDLGTDPEAWRSWLSRR